MTKSTSLRGFLSRLFHGRTRPAEYSAGNAGIGARDAGGAGATMTLAVDPPGPKALRIHYAPRTDGDPDAGEIVWAWVPYAEQDGRGKDRPVLVIARASADRVYAVRLTSKAHDGDLDFLPIGAGRWDPQGRASWVDIEQIYTVHAKGMRREAAALDLERFMRVADALRRRYGWTVVTE